jgi:hypothetical protein
MDLRVPRPLTWRSRTIHGHLQPIEIVYFELGAKVDGVSSKVGKSMDITSRTAYWKSAIKTPCWIGTPSPFTAVFGLERKEALELKAR